MGKKIQCIGRYAMNGSTLGKGNFAHVELATHGVTEVKVAIKIIDTRKIKDEYIRTNLHREARIMASLRHPNIIRLYETLKATTLYCLVTEYAAGGELLAYIKEQKDCRLGESASRSFIRQLVSAAHYLHERRIVHRDLKMENIMLDEKKKNIKLIDFGLSNILKEDESLKTHCGSPEYAAPELFIVGKTYGSEVDIWSLGIIMYAMILGRLPFCTPFRDEYHRQRMLQQIQKGLSPMHDREMQTLSADCRNLLHQLIEPNPELRIPMAEILVHPWITKNDRCPFFTYVPPPRNKSLRNETVSELAALMDMKKGVVNETVKDHRADELSAMYNMIMDNKKKQLGLHDIDHTKRAWQERNARSRSGERDKSLTPDNSKTKASLVTRKIATGKKSGAGSRAKPKNRPIEVLSGANTSRADRPPSERTRLNVQIDSEPGSSSSRMLISSVPAPVTPHDRPLYTVPPPARTAGPSVGNPGTGPDQRVPQNVPTTSTSIDPSRIPLSQRRVPPPKLSLTLDLSVTNPGVSTRQPRDDQRSAAAVIGAAVAGSGATSSLMPFAVGDGSGTCSGLTVASGGGLTGGLGTVAAVATDCSYGIAASSGVPPRLSPKDASAKTRSTAAPLTTSSASAGATAPSAGVPSSLPPPSSSMPITATSSSSSSSMIAGFLSATKARRPSSLQCSRLSQPLSSSQPRHQLRRPSSSPVQGQGQGLVAPKAVPEDSVIDSCSTEDDGSDNRFPGTLMEAVDSSGDTMHADLLNGLLFGGGAGDDLKNIELCRDEAQQLLLARATSSLSRGFVGQRGHQSLLFRPEQPPAAVPSPDDSILDLLDDESRRRRDSSSRIRLPPHSPPLCQVDSPTTTPPGDRLAATNDDMRSSFVHQNESRLAGSDYRKSSSSSSSVTFHNQFDPSAAAVVVVAHRATPVDGVSSVLLLGSVAAPSAPAPVDSVCSLPSRTTTTVTSDSATLLGSSSSTPGSNRGSSLGSKRRSLALSFSAGSEGPVATGVGSSGRLAAPKSLYGTGLSPGSPSYDAKHNRFSHIGSHALDVFFSPDERSPTGFLWRPVVNRLQSSPVGDSTSRRQADPFDGFLMTESQSTLQTVQLAPLITSLDIFTEEDDDDEEEEEEEEEDDDEEYDGRNRGTVSVAAHHRSVRPSTIQNSLPCSERTDQHTSCTMNAMSSTIAAAEAADPGAVPHPRLPGASDEMGPPDWLRLPVTTSLIQGDSLTSMSAGSSNIWPEQMTQSCPVSSNQRLLTSGSESSISQDSLYGNPVNNGTAEQPATSRTTNATHNDAQSTTASTTETTAATHVACHDAKMEELTTANDDDDDDDAKLAKKRNKNPSTATPSLPESKIPRPSPPPPPPPPPPSSVRNRFPVIGSLLNRDRWRSISTVSSQKQLTSTSSSAAKKEERRSLKRNASLSRSSRVLSWRQGFAHWLQLSRVTSAANSNNNIIRSTNQKHPNNHRDKNQEQEHGLNTVSGQSLSPPSSSSSVAPPGGGGGGGPNSAPMSITLISNHGYKSSLTIPNNYTEIHGPMVVNDEETKHGSQGVLHQHTSDSIQRHHQPLVTSLSSSSAKRSPLHGPMHSLLDVVDSISSTVSAARRSPLARKLRTRKVQQWQECEKCAHSDHSSDDSLFEFTGSTSSASASVARNRTGGVDDAIASSKVSLALNNISQQHWT